MSLKCCIFLTWESSVYCLNQEFPPSHLNLLLKTKIPVYFHSNFTVWSISCSYDKWLHEIKMLFSIKNHGITAFVEKSQCTSRHSAITFSYNNILMLTRSNFCIPILTNHAACCTNLEIFLIYIHISNPATQTLAAWTILNVKLSTQVEEITYHLALHCLADFRWRSEAILAHWFLPYFITAALRISSWKKTHTM